MEDGSSSSVTRDFTVAVFVVCEARVLLHWHRKLRMWLPPGGHIEVNELPDDAAIREVAEETGLAVTLIGARGLPTSAPGDPEQLVVPAGIQLEAIGESHEHIDLVYFAVIPDAHIERPPQPNDEFQWVHVDDMATLPISNEVRAWSCRAIQEVP
jgi:8-oxo-dGTP pyrophosphatase MutT (NUDIX family)